ncbi:N-acetylmuramoyl-L-alanine amidase [Pseudoxanthomonas kalamensis DSM 18571]|uniref:N-acetylmuramoyl-L-alanine amidase n=1 Tax=Pseudoxanthomonas kalamensis TaxID=289483 RepID=UPI001390B23C|nr:N-acetylmuramoyl-L-alanine amidase [Pseudoxanthomonas kalamensis]KAF1711454.1 N-acetylmuramoyl-L-alanine amidase [Pseudoxanthomonas kalamensis DSM 18571]
MRNPLLALLLVLALGACSTAPVRVDTRYDSVAQGDRVQYLILHYTVSDFDESVYLLAEKGRVSSHYLVRDDPVRVYRLVDESRMAYHAGRSYWAGAAELNASSIGIEIVNPGYVNTPEGRVYAPYPPAQIDTVIRLVKEIVARHGIRPDHVLGHADIAPGRKQDPGPLFPWKRLAEAGIIPWPDPAQVAERLALYRGQPLPEVAWFQQKLAAVGYRVPDGGELDEPTRAAISTFQMKYRPADIAGEPDAETAALLEVATTPGGMRMQAEPGN